MEEGERIVICMGSSCFARGNRNNLEVLERFLKEQGLNVRVELAGSRCEECCKLGPNVQIGGVMHHQVDTGTLIDLLNARFATGSKE
jgi:NADH:ubiquinone oxidoreductase subunit E